MHGCARGPPPVGRWGGRSNPPLYVYEPHLNQVFYIHIYTIYGAPMTNCIGFFLLIAQIIILEAPIIKKYLDGVDSWGAHLCRYISMDTSSPNGFTCSPLSIGNL